MGHGGGFLGLFADWVAQTLDELHSALGGLPDVEEKAGYVASRLRGGALSLFDSLFSALFLRGVFDPMLRFQSALVELHEVVGDLHQLPLRFLGHLVRLEFDCSSMEG